MKKLIVATVALTAGIVLAEGIESKNTVGYQAQSFTQGFNYRCATFVSTDKTRATMTLGDIIPNEDFVNSSIQFLTSAGATAKVTFGGRQVSEIYTYWEEEDAEDGAGWYLLADDDATQNCNDRVIAFGEAFCVTRTGSEADATLTTAGNVQDTAVTYSFAQNFNYVGNCSPVEITLGDITPNEDFVNSSIQFLTEGGATAKVTFGGRQVSEIYTYWEEDDAEDGAGWYLLADDDATQNCNAKVIAPGQAFCVTRTGSEADATLTIPAPLN